MKQVIITKVVVLALGLTLLALCSCTKSNQPIWVYEFGYKKYYILNDGDTVRGIKVKPDQFGNPIKEFISDGGQNPSAQGWTPIMLSPEQLDNVRHNLDQADGGATTLQVWKSRYADSSLTYMLNFGDPNRDGYTIDPAYENLTVRDLAKIVEVYQPGVLIEHTTLKASQRGDGTRIREEMYSSKK